MAYGARYRLGRMADSSGFYTSPGREFEPGDIFLDIPFPSLRFPLTFFRISYRKDPKVASVLTRKEATPKADDSPKCTLKLEMAMFVSHGCEAERVLRSEPLEKRHWLAAPIAPLSLCETPMQERTRVGTQPNKFYLPPSEYTGGKELFVDLRKITPIACEYFTEGKRICSLAELAQRDLYSQLGVFFSGLALYVQPIPCPNCGTEIDPTQFVVKSGHEPDID